MALWEMESEAMLTPREKAPLPEAQRRFEPMMLDSEPNTLPTELFLPHETELLLLLLLRSM